MSEGFDIGWLRLREAADRRARSRPLAQAFLAELPRRARVIDLAAGTGANARYLAGLTRAPLDWLLLDADRDLLNFARAPGRRVRRVRADLAHCPMPVRESCDGVVLSALLDLASAEWIDRFAADIAFRSVPCLAALSVDRRLSFRPAHRGDAAVVAGFAADQRRDKGLGGSALGPAAAVHLAQALRSRGVRVWAARSDWRLRRHDPALLRALIDGIAIAATRHSDRAAVAGWLATRRRQIDSGRLEVDVGHVDVLGLPVPAGAARPPRHRHSEGGLV